MDDGVKDFVSAKLGEESTKQIRRTCKAAIDAILAVVLPSRWMEVCRRDWLWIPG